MRWKKPLGKNGKSENAGIRKKIKNAENTAERKNRNKTQ